MILESKLIVNSRKKSGKSLKYWKLSRIINNMRQEGEGGDRKHFKSNENCQPSIQTQKGKMEGV